MGDANDRRAQAVDFATHNVWGDKLSASEREECITTLRELVESFGPNAILGAVTELGVGVRNQGTRESVMQAIRAMCVLVLESDRKDLTVQLVGKLVHLELATGKRISLRELGRENGISKQAVSNRLKMYAARLALPRPDSTPETRRAHQLMNRRNYGSPATGRAT